MYGILSKVFWAYGLGYRYRFRRLTCTDSCRPLCWISWLAGSFESAASCQRFGVSWLGDCCRTLSTHRKDILVQIPWNKVSAEASLGVIQSLVRVYGADKLPP